jgi:hypothetical protein
MPLNRKVHKRIIRGNACRIRSSAYFVRLLKKDVVLIVTSLLHLNFGHKTFVLVFQGRQDVYIIE